MFSLLPQLTALTACGHFEARADRLRDDVLARRNARPAGRRQDAERPADEDATLGSGGAQRNLHGHFRLAGDWAA
eukprot:13715639-Alexandrium_andersonii.AAC.1